MFITTKGSQSWRKDLTHAQPLIAARKDLTHARVNPTLFVSCSYIFVRRSLCSAYTSDLVDSELGLYFVPLDLCVVVLGDATEV